MSVIKSAAAPFGALNPIESMLVNGKSFKDTLKPQNIVQGALQPIKKPSAVISGKEQEFASEKDEREFAESEAARRKSFVWQG